MTRGFRLTALAVVACTPAACALGPGNSYVSRLEAPADAGVLASAMTDFLADELPAGSSALVLEPTPPAQAANALTPALLAALRDRGFAVADAAQSAAPGTHRIRYLVTPIDNGELIRVTVDGGLTEAARFFVRDNAGDLQAGGPFTVRQIAETD